MTQPTPSDHSPVESYETKRDLLHDRRALAIIGAGLVVVAAIGVFVVKPMLSSSSSDSSTGTVANAHVHPAGAASASPSVSPSAVAHPTPAPALVVRDPFSPLYAAPVAAAGGSGASAAPSAAATTPITQVSTVIVPEPGPTVTRTITKTVGTAGPTTAAKYTLKFDKVVSAKTFTIEVTLNGHVSTLTLGEAFPSTTDGPFEFESLITSQFGKAENNGPAQFLYGDTTFSLDVGQTQYEN